ncbi:transcription factor BIM1 isoform X2 [Gossypium arboreum]|uniref:transcription factor BIM1 isoform X2 n=1 Tax=Gossypium arboreum TaxID=29729 RepID=UPI0022F16BE7|nr:transcription factor BIM1 isoform X2 [Gossypium arboreum]
MELPQSWPLGAEGRKPIHDFLSLYSHSSVLQDPRPPAQDGYRKTHDFLQLEALGKAIAKEETTAEEAMAEKPLPPPPPAPPPRSAEHVLPGGIGTYSISHISSRAEGALFTVARRSISERNDETSNCSSYTGSGFTLWEESAAKKGKTGKENTGETPAVRAGKERQWATSSLERPSQSSSTNNHRNSFSSLPSSRPSSKQKSFMEMMKSAQYNDFEEDENFNLKKESSTTTRSKGELRVKVDGKSAADQKANTPRSKHSATEQRRRSKINDRFQRLKGIIPNSDQKRDKASFLLEVIEYIQFLQEKVHIYEGAYQGWNHEPSKLMPWRNNETPTQNHADQSRAINSVSTPSALVFSVAPNIPGTAMNPVDSDMSTATTLRPVDLGPAMMNKTMPFAVSPQPNSITSAQSTPTLPSDAETNGALPIKKLKEQELTVEGGTISISSVYSQGLLNTLTQALQASGVDLSHASLSVQIELGKQSSTGYTAPTSTLKGQGDSIHNSRDDTFKSWIC